MTPIHKHRLPIKYRHPNTLRNTLYAIGIASAVIFLWWSITAARAAYLTVVEAESRIAAAEVDRDMLLEILRGNRPATTEDGLEFARVAWEKVKLVDGLK